MPRAIEAGDAAGIERWNKNGARTYSRIGEPQIRRNKAPELNDGLELKHLLATIFDELRPSCVSSERSPYASQSFTAN